MARPTTETYEERRERQRETERRYRERNKERLREMRIEQGKRYRERHREERNARKRAQYAAKADEINAKRKQAYAADPEPRREAARKYSADHREQLRQRSKENYPKYKERFRVYRANRRARELAAEGSFTEQEWQELLTQFGNRCAYCGAEGPMTRDHKLPLSRGGTNWINNIVPACMTCNNRKHARTEAEFFASLSQEVKLG